MSDEQREHGPGEVPAASPTDQHPVPSYAGAPRQDAASIAGEQRPPFATGEQRVPFAPGQPSWSPWGTPGPATAPNPYLPPNGNGTALLEKPQKPRGRTGIVVAALIAGLVGGGAAGAGTYALLANDSVPLLTQQAATSGGTVAPASGSIAAAAAKATPSTVDISVNLGRGTGEGSGVILTADGNVLTNNHVVAGAQGPITVTLADGSEHQATVVGTSPSYDLAVIKIQGVSGLTPAELGKSADLQVGQQVVAIGSPQGLTGTVTNGIISAFNRTVAVQGEDGSAVVYNGLQTDAPINPGNSGGPLVNVDGKVVGINTLILSQSGGNEGLGFAAPSNIVRNVFDQIRKYGRVRRGEIGVRAQTITSLLAEGLHLPRETGVILSDVYPGTPAEKSGLKPGDIVISLDGKPMENGRQMQVNLYGRAVGDTVQLEIERGTTVQPVLVKVAEREDDPTRFSPLVAPGEPYIDRLGVLGLTLDAKAAEMLPDLRVTSGVVIAATSAATLSGAEGQLKSGDVIHDVNSKPVTSVEELRTAIARLKAGDAVAVGCMVDSCQRCDQCRKGEEQLCREGSTLTYSAPDRITKEMTYGGYSKHLVARQEFVLRVPDGLDLARAAPGLVFGRADPPQNIKDRSRPSVPTYTAGT